MHNNDDNNTRDTQTTRSVSSAPAATKRPTMLRRLLSHHELATLLLLLHAPVDAHAKPEIPMLQEAGLVESIASDAGAPRIRLTDEGNAVLRGLGLGV
jgi:16S rRNA C1402 (ribose-2'-O) methylase RsmI